MTGVALPERVTPKPRNDGSCFGREAPVCVYRTGIPDARNNNTSLYSFTPPFLPSSSCLPCILDFIVIAVFSSSNFRSFVLFFHFILFIVLRYYYSLPCSGAPPPSPPLPPSITYFSSPSSPPQTHAHFLLVITQCCAINLSYSHLSGRRHGYRPS